MTTSFAHLKFKHCVLLLSLTALFPNQLISQQVEASENSDTNPSVVFAEAPKVIRKDDAVSIEFTLLMPQDVTIAIESNTGIILRHLASGVLGSNAPPPFQKDSLKQCIVWDGKDDQGRYVDDTGLVVRVSVGLKAQFDRPLLYDPRKFTSKPLVSCSEEGVYVYDGLIVDHLRMYDHDGRYLRTIYPFPANRLPKIRGLHWREFPDNQRFPVKEGFHLATLLSSGDNAGFDGSIGMDAWGHFNGYWGNAASVIASHGGKLAVIKHFLNRLTSNADSDVLPLRGPKTSLPALRRGPSAPDGVYGKGGQTLVPPTSAAFSPDGKYLYLTGFVWKHESYSWPLEWLHGVVQIGWSDDSQPKIFAGDISQGDDKAGKRDNQLAVPTSVACDQAGQVYVSDYLNDRIQVFSPNGKLVKSLKCDRPASVQIDQKTGEIYIFTWFQRSTACVKGGDVLAPKLRVYDAFETFKLVKEYDLPLRGYKGKNDIYAGDAGLNHRAVLDSWATPPRLWLVSGEGTSLQIWKMGENKLELQTDYSADLERTAGKRGPPYQGRQKLHVDPRSGNLYVAEGQAGSILKSTKDLLEINPHTGGRREVPLPFDSEDLTFGIDGLVYLRTGRIVARYNFDSWREVAFDYGEELSQVCYSAHSDRRTSDLLAGIVLPNTKWGWHHGSISVAPNGNIAIAFLYGDPKEIGLRTDTRMIHKTDRYAPRLYPGRAIGSHHNLVFIYDKHGKVLYDDCLPGLDDVHGIGLGKEDSLYVLSSITQIAEGKRHFNSKTGTLIKARPKTARIISSSHDCPVPLTAESRPKRSPDGANALLSEAWVEGANWQYGGVGFCGDNIGVGCSCWNSRFCLDLFERSFLPEMDRHTVSVLDSAGNKVLEIGQYGNEDSAGADSLAPLSGDGIGLFYPAYTGTHTDKRLFIADHGNSRIVSALLSYQLSIRKGIPSATKIMSDMPGTRPPQSPDAAEEERVRALPPKTDLIQNR